MQDEISALRAENELLRSSLRNARLENAIRSSNDEPITMDQLGKFLLYPMQSKYLAMVMLHAHADPLRRHNSGMMPYSDPGAGQGVDQRIEYYTDEALNTVVELCRRYFAPQVNCIVFRIDKDIGILLNPLERYTIDSSVRSGGYLQGLKRRVTELIYQLDETLGFRNTAVISRIWEEHISLRKMYLETIDTYDYSWNQTGAIHTYEELCAAPMTAEDRLEISALEQEFRNDIERMLYYEAAAVLDAILKKQFYHAVPLKEINVSVTARLRNALAIAEVTPAMRNLDMTEMSTLLRYISGAVSVPELQDRIHDFFASLADFSPQNAAGKGELILEYIQTNYQNPALNAQLLCDRFRISHSYLSRLIKAETGQGLVDCIHRFRVDHAKILLRETDMSVEQVAIHVGFSSRYSLIRSFRTQEGMTPSEYRSRMKQSIESQGE